MTAVGVLRSSSENYLLTDMQFLFWDCKECVRTRTLSCWSSYMQYYRTTSDN